MVDEAIQRITFTGGRVTRPPTAYNNAPLFVGQQASIAAGTFRNRKRKVSTARRWTVRTCDVDEATGILRVGGASVGV